jgi:HPt (histidine-containing phosphotransfer) domain-containing protein
MTCAFDDIDHERMLRAAHTLKSSSANMGSLALSDACREMERAAQAGDMNEYRRMTEVCLTAYREFEAALREIS